MIGRTHMAIGLCAVVAAVWAVGALSQHRAFSHSLIGAAVFIAAVDSIAMHVANGAVSLGLCVGYALHIVADLFAGGTSPFWPLGKRFGWRLVKTSGTLDHMVGGVPIFAFVLSLVGIV